MDGQLAGGRHGATTMTLSWQKVRLSLRAAPAKVLRLWLTSSFLFLLPAGIAVAGLGAPPVLLALALLLALLWTAVGVSAMRDDGALALLRAFTSLESTNLRLRRPTAADAGAIVDTVDDEVVRANGWGPKHRESLVLTSHYPQVLLSSGNVVVADRDTDAVLGLLSFSAVDRPLGTAELGMWFGPGARGRGLGTELVTAATELAWLLGLTSVRLGTSSTNVAMRRAAERAGGDLVKQGPLQLPDGSTISSCWYLFRAPDPALRRSPSP